VGEGGARLLSADYGDSWCVVFAYQPYKRALHTQGDPRAASMVARGPGRAKGGGGGGLGLKAVVT
jgi:hypothetical protein